MQKRMALLAGTAGLGIAAQAMAAPPPSVVGTWRGVANQTQVQIVINAQAAGVCGTIRGTMQNLPAGGVSNVLGWYCPSTGRISFERVNPANNDALQAYVGNVADDASVDRMAGTFSAYPVAGAGANGEYPFQLAR